MQRYKEIIDNWQAFREACEKPVTSSVRKNHIKAGKEFEERLRREFDDVEQSDWNKDVFRLKDVQNPGKSSMHWLGEYYVQEESAILPVNVLNPQKSDRVLDMCAAPGGKTTQIASLIENEGVIISNDDSSQRLKSLHANVYRTGSACVNVTNYDGRQIPGNERFDRILVDAPCTGEADRARRAIENAEYNEEDIEEAFLNAGADMGEIKGLSKLQKQLIERAAGLLKEGGTLVYSTCTFGPEENEEVVKHAIEETDLELQNVETDAKHVRGVKEFQDEQYGDEMRKTVRIYPHHLESGGIYVAKFGK